MSSKVMYCGRENQNEMAVAVASIQRTTQCFNTTIFLGMLHFPTFGMFGESRSNCRIFGFSWGRHRSCQLGIDFLEIYIITKFNDRREERRFWKPFTWEMKE